MKAAKKSQFFYWAGPSSLPRKPVQEFQEATEEMVTKLNQPGEFEEEISFVEKSI